MRPLRIALLQLEAAGGDQDANLAEGERACRTARAMGADIALFPEMWNNGYTLPRDPGEQEEWAQGAIGLDDPFVTHFRALARTLDMAIALTYLERWPGSPRNAVSLIDRRGEVVFTYAKVHTCDFGPERACTSGDDFRVGVLDTAAGPVKVGAMICYDHEFPESARILMLKGAELILVPVATVFARVRIDQLKTRAFENMVAVAMANYAGAGAGHSVAFSPVICDEHGNLLDPLVVEAGTAEGIYPATFDLDELRAHRAREPWGNAFRRPDRYGLLGSSAVAPPFVRSRARR